MSNPDLVERALRDPRRAFGTPEAVAGSEELGPGVKRAALERWREQAAAQAEAEGGAVDPPDLLLRLARALAMLDTETGAHDADHDQGFYTSIGDIGRD